MLRLLLLAFPLLSQENSRFGAPIPQHQDFLSNIRPITADNASRKPHWSLDGRRLMFVSQEQGKCPQAYWYDLDTKARTLASTGEGSVRTVAPIVKNKVWLFDSTAASGDACAPTALTSVPATFDIYSKSEKGKVERLTTADGYDAELDVSPDGKQIVFASQASGDIEIWTMEPNGMNKRQLTRSPGYDGEPNFSNDGRRIVYRSYRARSNEAQKLTKEELAFGKARLDPSEIFVMNPKGLDQKQITSFNCLILDPVWTPDNRRIVFSANLPACNAEKFELFMINLDGTGLVQLTKDSQFAGEVSFAPNGSTLAFTRNGNIHLAEWQAPAPPPETLNPLSKP
jgi:Tol biopolymer transport system component